MVPTEIGGVHVSKSAKRRARKTRVMDKAVADGKDFINSFDKHLKYTQASHDYKRLYNNVRRGTPCCTTFLTPSPDPTLCPTFEGDETGARAGAEQNFYIVGRRGNSER